MAENQFQLLSIPDAHVRNWQSCYVIFDQRNGETLVLEGVAADVFGRLKRGAASHTELVAEVRASRLDEVQDFEALVTATVNQFRQHQILKQVQPLSA